MGKTIMSRFRITTIQKSTTEINKEIQKSIKRLFGEELTIKVKSCYIEEPRTTMTNYGFFHYNDILWNIQIGNYRKERNIMRYGANVLLYEAF